MWAQSGSPQGWALIVSKAGTRMQIRRIVSIALLTAGSSFLGCGSSSNSSGEPVAAQQVQVDSQVAKGYAQSSVSSVVSISDLTTSSTAASGQMIAGSLMGSAMQGMALVAPSGNGSTSSALTEANSIGTARSALDSAGCSCNQTSCTFTNCSDSDDGAQATVNGTISWADGTVKCDLKWTIDLAGSSSTEDATGTYELGMKCDLKVSPTLVSGTLDSTGRMDVSNQGQTASVAWTTAVKYNDVTLSNRQPTGGSVDLSATYRVTMSSGSGSGSYTGSAHVTFP